MPKPPAWLDPLNKALGIVPESILRGTQAFESAVTPEMAPSADPDATDYWEKYVASNVPQGFRDFADFMGTYAGMAGVDPGGVGGPGKAILGPALKRTAGPGSAAQVARTQLREGVTPYAKRLSKETPSGVSTRKGLAGFATSPKAEFRSTEVLPKNVLGQYSSPEVMAHRRPDLPWGSEMIETLPTTPKRTNIHESAHAIWPRLGEAQKEAWRNAMGSGQVPHHPKMALKTYQELPLEQRFDENFGQWMADMLTGEVSLPGGGTRPFGAEDLPVVNYLQEFIRPVSTKLQGPSPLTPSDIDPLLKAMGQ